MSYGHFIYFPWPQTFLSGAKPKQSLAPILTITWQTQEKLDKKSAFGQAKKVSGQNLETKSKTCAKIQ